MRKLLSLTLLLAVIALAYSAVVGAQSPKSITVEPFLQEITLTNADKQKEFSIKVTNNTSGDYVFRPLAVDFGSLDETGGLLFAGADAPALVKKYGLANWLILDKSVRKLAPNQSLTLKVKIDNREDLAPGGHYAAVVLTSEQLDNADTDELKVSFQKNISSLVFGKKLGGESYGLELDKAQSSSSVFKLPSEVSLRFKNTGNIHVVPRGLITIKDNFGSVVAEGTINTESGIILPESFRKISVELNGQSQPWWPGYYSVEIQYRYDGNNEFRTEISRIFYVGNGLILVAALLVMLAAFLLRKLWVKRLKNKKEATKTS